MKKLMSYFIFIFMSFFLVTSVSAKEYTYYLENDKYVLCVDEKCSRYTANQLDQIDKNKSVTLNNQKYTFKNKVTDNTDANNNSNKNETVPADTKNVCTRLKSPLKFIGYIVLIVKIIIPILLIIFGMMDLFKAIIGQKDGEISKSVRSFAWRVIASVLIFFIPTIINFAFNLIDSWSEVQGEYKICQKCILQVTKCD